jgi:hypothetical protein
MPDRRPLDFRTYDEIVDDVTRLRAAGYTRCGNWDLGQVCDHLAKAFTGSIDGIPFRAPWLFRTLVAPLAWPRVMKTRRIPSGVRIPEKYVAPNVDVDEAVGRLTAAVRRWQAHRGDVAEHPFFGRLTREQWGELHLIHGAHHLSFLLPAELPAEGISR